MDKPRYNKMTLMCIYTTNLILLIILHVALFLRQCVSRRHIDLRKKNLAFIENYQGPGVTENDSTAPEWYLKAASLGDADSQSLVSRMYHDGVTQTNYSQARLWAEKSAEQGDIDAITLPGVMNYQGEEGDKDVYKARVLAEKGAEAGNAEVMKLLGSMYFYGVGGVCDLTEAQEYTKKAISSGCLLAEKLLRKIKEEAAKEKRK